EAAVRLLTDAVDDITTIDDFLAVSENHILEDVNKCVVALQEGDPDSLERTAGAIRGRASRVCSVVTQEMDNYEPCIYTKRVLEAVTVLRDQGECFSIMYCRKVRRGAQGSQPYSKKRNGNLNIIFTTAHLQIMEQSPI
ncbi:jg23295, partial [Pararge aegeria aegeria]